MTVSVGSVISAASYNSIRSNIQQILNPTQDGYGPDLLEASTATVSMLTSAEHWTSLWGDINKCIKHQTGADMTLPLPVPGEIITATFYNSLESLATTAVANSTVAHPSQLTTFVSSTNFTTVAWNSQVQVIRDYVWDSNLEAHYHFNLGGYILGTIGYSGTPAGAEDNAFVEFVNHANAAYSTLKTPYTRANWRGAPGTVTFTYSTSTALGVFSASTQYVRTSGALQVTSIITPPVGLTGINLDPVSTSTLYYSFDAIGCTLPGIATGRKILTYTSLSPFSLVAGERSTPQILTISNVGAEPVIISSIVATSNEVIGFAVSTATSFTNELSQNVIFEFPLTLASNDDLQVLVYYEEPLRATSEFGTFNNSIIITSNANRGRAVIPTVQTVTSPDFDFDLILTDPNQAYSYSNWATEFGLNLPEKELGIQIANYYYLSNGYIGTFNGIARYGLYRRPDTEGLRYWVNYTNTYAGGDYLSIANTLFNSITSLSRDNGRSRSEFKPFDPGYGNGDFYDKTLVETIVSGSNTRRYSYVIQPRFGSINASNGNPGYTATLLNQQFNGSPSAEAEAAFSVGLNFDGGGTSLLRGPSIFYRPILVNNTGTYSTDMTVTVYATDLTGAPVSKSKTVDLSILQTQLTDGNLVKWVSGYEANNSVMGLSYDRIGGKLHLTVAFGSGADGSPTLAQNGYGSNYINVDNLGITGDQFWGSFDVGFNEPMYKQSVENVYSEFLNDYGVWVTNPTRIDGLSYPYNVWIYRSFKFTAPYTGPYSVLFSVDNTGYIEIDGVHVIDLLSRDGSNYGISHAATINLTAGVHVVTLGFLNYSRRVTNNNPGAVAAVIRDNNNFQLWSTLNAVRPVPPYLYWQEVYRVPIIPNVATTYPLAQYLVKNAYGTQPYAFPYTYGAYYGSRGTEDAASIMSVSSDGKGNLSFNWKPQTGSTGDEELDKTIANMSQLPYYFSYRSDRKVSIGPAGNTTKYLIGVTTNAVRTQDVPTPVGVISQPPVEPDSIFVNFDGTGGVEFNTVGIGADGNFGDNAPDPAALEAAIADAVAADAAAQLAALNQAQDNEDAELGLAMTALAMAAEAGSSLGSFGDEGGFGGGTGAGLGGLGIGIGMGLGGSIGIGQGGIGTGFSIGTPGFGGFSSGGTSFGGQDANAPGSDAPAPAGSEDFGAISDGGDGGGDGGGEGE